MVAGFKHAAPGHQPSQQAPLQFAGFRALVDALRTGTEWERYGAALVLRVLLSCLRPAHCPRATRLTADCTPRTTVWSVC